MQRSRDIGSNEGKVTRCVHDDVKEPLTIETSHTPLLRAEEQVLTLPMDNGCFLRDYFPPAASARAFSTSWMNSFLYPPSSSPVLACAISRMLSKLALPL